jgi:hypothetical protein
MANYKDANSGLKKFKEFHQMEPKKVGPLSNFKMPTSLVCAGTMTWIYYSSTKWGKGRYDYKHEHESGVKLYVNDNIEGSQHATPQWICKLDTIWKLGACIGYEFIDKDNTKVSATCRGCTLWAAPNGKALLILDGNKVHAIIYGGKLGVEARGIVH